MPSPASPWLSMETEEEKKRREAAAAKGGTPVARPTGDVEGNQKTIASFFRKR